MIDNYGDYGDANLNLPTPAKTVVDLARQIDAKNVQKIRHSENETV